ncbi:MAG: tetratricopeptide repeat protein [Alphaproteobacteria bacterium]|jgi:tetratricopeptide (TPR) repeat protein|nr:tetratricopeptide repeat protein [Alphaproteobacteria bacterium]MDP6515593.1 tetratricopeptide repeat protein [Alphaproteobacteria bacterium]
MGRLVALVLVVMVAVAGHSGWARQDDPRLGTLFARLKAAESETEARGIELSIWQIWVRSGEVSLDRLMAGGMAAMGGGDNSSALIAFNTIVEAAPDFAEGWNKRATIYWLMGDYAKSVADIDRTLALEPRHFGALSGLALIRDAQDRPAEALAALRRAAEIHPRMVNLERRIKRLDRQLGDPI